MLLLFPIVAESEGAIIEYTLSSPTLSPTTATFDVSLDFVGDTSADELTALQLSVWGSDPLLTSNNTDFSRFSFSLDSTLPLWFHSGSVPMGGIGFSGLEAIQPTPGLTPTGGPLTIGTLSVDLSGIAAGTPLVVNLNGGPPGLSSDAGGLIDGSLVLSFSDPLNSHSVSFTEPGGVSFTSSAVPEPSAMLIWLAGGLGLLGLRRRRRRIARFRGRAFSRLVPQSAGGMSSSRTRAEDQPSAGIPIGDQVLA